MPDARNALATARSGPGGSVARALVLILIAAGADAGATGSAKTAAPADAAVAEACAVLAALDFDAAVGARVSLRATLVPADGELPARCRATATVAPEIGFEAWLPVDDWNGKLLVTGCYGLCGSIRADQMEDAAARGYATATTDGGHGQQGSPDGRWAYDNTALEDDFGHRAVHVTAVLAQALATAYYGNEPAHAYFRGCSTGGRQALVAATRNPDDFDGIIAGAPFDQRRSVPFMIWADAANTGADGRPLLKRPQFELLHKAALEACDGDDGQVDGIIGNPAACSFQPEALACSGAVDASCLGPEQLAAARRIYAGPAGSSGRRPAAFGAAIGSEAGWEQQLIGRDGRPSAFHATGQDWMRYHAFEPDPPADADLPAFDFDRDPPRLAASNARIGYTADLGRFAARDGRLIVWHGWADASLQPSHTLAWWQEAMQENGGADALARVARLFLLPGVQHCGGGPGAGDVDYLSALERWVETDEAPQLLAATRAADSVPVSTRQRRFPVITAVQLRRPLFPYPDVARYRGSGDPLDPLSYERVKPPAAPTPAQ